MDILHEVRSNLELPYPGDDKIIEMLQDVPGALIVFREFDGVLNSQLIAPYETVAPYLLNKIGRDPFAYGDMVSEWTFDNGLVIYLRRMPNTMRGSPSCKIRVENATPVVAEALQNAPAKKGSPE